MKRIWNIIQTKMPKIVVLFFIAAMVLSAQQAFNVLQIGGTSVDSNSGTKSNGTLRVVIATDQPQLTNHLLVTPDSNSSVNVAQVGGSSVATAATGTPLVGISDGSGTKYVADPCQANAKIFVNINISSNAKLVSGTSSKKIYICSISIPPQSGAVNFALVEGTGSTCATSTAAVPGVTGGDGTAAKGANIAANGGFMLGSGVSSVGQESVSADDLCAFTGAQLSGGFSYVVQ